MKKPILVPGTLKTNNKCFTLLLDCFKVSYSCSYIKKLKYAETNAKWKHSNYFVLPSWFFSSAQFNYLASKL